MINSNLIKNEIYKFRENELIIASKLYREKFVDIISEASFYKTLERMCKSNTLCKIAKGTYYLPKHSKYGIVPISDEDIVSAFTDNESGAIIGYSLYNALNLTTQVSKIISVLSSSLDGLTKSIRNVKIECMAVEYSKNIINIINGLEVLQNYYEIQDLNNTAFIEFTKDFALSFNEESFEKVISKRKYSKSTISFVREILKYYGVDNHLDNYLSSLSTYKHPRMEEIYGIA